MMHTPLWSYETLVDEGFSACAVRGESLSGKLDYLVTYLVVTYDVETSFALAEHLSHIIDGNYRITTLFSM